MDLIGEPPKGRGIGPAVTISVVLHAALLMLFTLNRQAEPVQSSEEAARFVQILRQAPQSTPQFEQAPGPAIEQRVSPDAPFSNANRRATMPDPTGDQPTQRPGEGGTYVPGGAPAPPQGRPDGEALTRPLNPSAARADAQPTAAVEASSAFRAPSQSAAAEPATRGIDWNSAIQEVGKIASLSGEGVGSPGGEPGFAESGPISFESQWYEWGDYADHMVTKIRRHWYDNMPSLIRMGMKGVVTIQFTIQRSGAITDVRIVKSSEIPPFDFAAKKAIELASPLRPLPADFPNRSERVTAQFYYNLTPAKK